MTQPRHIARDSALLLVVVLCGCARADYATVTIGYQARSQKDEWKLETPARQRIGTAFKRIALEQGYKCNERGKRTEEITCAGPKRMNVLFAPELNRREFTIHFDWLEVDDRTREEFDGHVRRFSAAMTAAVPDAQVVLTDGRDPR